MAVQHDRSNLEEAHVKTWHEHIRILSEDIGPRGPTTKEERRGAEYCHQTLDELGLSPNTENFSSARSIFQPHLIASIGMLIAFAIYPLAGRVSAISAFLISFVVLISDLLELGFRDNIIRRIMPKGASQNVVAILQPANEHLQDLVLIGHIDTQRTPIVFSSLRWLAAYKIFTTVAFIGFTIQVLLYLLGIFTLWNWIWPVSAIGALCALLLAAMCIQADSTPFCNGANDNASAVGLVLTLANYLNTYPLNHTRVWFVCTGCEEVQHYGAIDFFQRHKSEFVNPKALVFEMLGCAGPSWLTKEGIVIPFYASEGMVELAEEIARKNPDLDAYPSQISGGNTEMADALRSRVPAITLFGLTKDGVAPYWHMLEDTFDKIDPQVLTRNFTFALKFIRTLDSQEVSQ